jgi:hypothetical protein
MVRGVHSKKEIEAALAYAESHGWRIRGGGKGHAWGKMYCPYNDAECRCGEFCISSVWSTPKNPGISNASSTTARRTGNENVRGVSPRRNEGRSSLWNMYSP